MLFYHLNGHKLERMKSRRKIYDQTLIFYCKIIKYPKEIMKISNFFQMIVKV